MLCAYYVLSGYISAALSTRRKGFKHQTPRLKAPAERKISEKKKKTQTNKKQKNCKFQIENGLII